ncbi:ABC transporter permease [Fuchsiella alkaliacetigena]|nr:ABC transporter permease [Fuchsiella alkaliacetigena]
MRFIKVSIQTIFAPLISTTLYLIIFAYSLRGREVVGYSVSYTRFIIPGLIVMGIIQNAFANTSSSLIIAKYQGTIIELLLAPFSYLQLSLGLMIGGIARGLAVGVAIYLVSIFFAGAVIAHPLLLLGSGTIIAGIFSLLGIIAGLWAKKFDHISIFSNFFITPLTFLSGVFYSVSSLPGVWSRVSLFNPVVYMVDLIRYSFIAESDINYLFSLTVISGAFIFLLILVTYLFKIGYKLKD